MINTNTVTALDRSHLHSLEFDASPMDKGHKEGIFWVVRFVEGHRGGADAQVNPEGHRENSPYHCCAFGKCIVNDV